MEGMIFNTEKPTYDAGKVFLIGLVAGGLLGAYLGFDVGKRYGRAYKEESKIETIATRSENMQRKIEEDSTIISGTIKHKYPISDGRYQYLPIEVEIDKGFKTNHPTYTFRCGDYMPFDKKTINLEALNSMISTGDSIRIRIDNYIYRQGIPGNEVNINPERIVEVSGRPLPLEELIKN